jgi:hypothetical protein
MGIGEHKVSAAVILQVLKDVANVLVEANGACECWCDGGVNVGSAKVDVVMCH